MKYVAKTTVTSNNYQKAKGEVAQNDKKNNQDAKLAN